MNALHSTSSSAVVTRLHDVGRSTEKSGVTNMRGCVRSAGRQHQTAAEQVRMPYMTVIDAPKGAANAYGETTGDRTARTEDADAEAAFTAYVQERRASCTRPPTT